MKREGAKIMVGRLWRGSEVVLIIVVLHISVRYLAPELPITGKATTSSDVYTFGALLLEVAYRRKPIEPNAPLEELVLVDWVWENYKVGRVLDVVRYLEGEVMVPGELRAPDDELEGKKYQMGIGGHDGFDDFLDSFLSSSFDNLSGSYSFRGNNNSHRDGMDQSFASLSTSPLSLLQHGRGDTTRLSRISKPDYD
ncbi:hypothetical protein F8388_024987 [Cannabis sativa]|uniref:Protein kinase domain-containing protein n=1 Tax=Cannabis sativa TaxID=3483 RepID=A0A7J6G3D0_CANSA|nr:hypothetical protein F8388_024987 [Cannabis sativa]